MARTASTKRKKKKAKGIEDLVPLLRLDIEDINQFLDVVFESRKGWSKEKINYYGKIAEEARKEEEETEQPLKEITPRKELGRIIARKAEEIKEAGLPKHMKADAVRSAIRLAEILESATAPKDLNFKKKWVKKRW